jgi:FkbM family methyltransferase
VPKVLRTVEMKSFHLLAKRASLSIFSKLPCKFHILKLLGLVLRVSLKKSNDVPRYLISDSKTSIYFSEISRGTLYIPSPSTRIEEIGNAYGADKLNFSDGDTVIDVGANIGEFGLYVKSRCAMTNVISIEPEEGARICCNFNNYDGKELTLDLAVWNQKGEFPLYLDAGGASSSLIASKNGMSERLIGTVTLDDLISSLHLEKILLIKIEAEGGEPEVLMGGKSLLMMTHFVALDVGPERGINRDSTSRQCIEILEDLGFIIKWQSGSIGRQTILFQNTHYQVDK